MRVAVISDLHGNYHAVEAVLEDIRTQGVDRIVCGGDIVNPFLRSMDVWELLKTLAIPSVRGNHEDYLLAYFRPQLRPEVRESLQFRPVQLVARHLGPEMVEELSRLPLDMTIPGPGGDDLYVCHASPRRNNRSFMYATDQEMTESLLGVRARTIVGGHIHHQWQNNWRGKRLVIAGSVGLPLGGRPRPEYSIMEHVKGEWQVRPRSVEYDQQGALKEFRESGCVRLGGPVAWLLYDELISAESRLMHFFARLSRQPGRIPQDTPSWEKIAREFLEELGRWRHVEMALES